MGGIRDMIRPARPVVPMIYAYTTPGIPYHEGCTKIGYTEQDVAARIAQQTHTAGIRARLEWQGNATYDDGTGECFTDHAFHDYLRKLGVSQPQQDDSVNFRAGDRNEWFRIDPQDARLRFFDFRQNRGVTARDDGCVPDVTAYTLRREQDEAVRRTLDYRAKHPEGAFLWNAKPRFGKTLSTYDFIVRSGAKRVLIVTNRPAIANSWYDDYEKFVGPQNGYFFVSGVDGVRDRRLVMRYDDYRRDAESRRTWGAEAAPGLIEFVSLQDLKGSVYFGGHYQKLREIRDIKWDLLVIDEAHEGVDTYKTDVAFDQIRRAFTLHLSGTPFKALANDKFPADAIYNWTYADEQRAKREWDGEGENPYSPLPRLNLFTYQMSDIVADQLERGAEIDGETAEFAFDLNEFFETRNGRFVHEESVDRFLDAMTTQEKFPFSTPELRSELRHTFWLLNRVESARLLAKKLNAHPVFKDYEVILAAGDGRLDDDDETKKSYDRVIAAIAKGDKPTITLSVGQLTTGITVKEWTAVLMLSNIKSPALYMQAAFRAQNPCLFRDGNGFRRKENAYVFDFDPARTLIIFEQFANDLTQDTAAGHGDAETRKKHVRELLNFFPVIGEDEQGSMTELDAEKVLSIPRKIKSQEVVRRGFMSDFLFQNISNVFHAPQEIIDIITQFTPVAEPGKKGTLDTSGVMVDEDGEVIVDGERVVGLAHDIFGDKRYAEAEEITDAIIAVTAEPGKKTEADAEKLRQSVRDSAIKKVIEDTKAHYGGEMTRRDEQQIRSRLTADADRAIGRVLTDHNIRQAEIEAEKRDALAKANTAQDRRQVDLDYERKKQESAIELHETITATVEQFVAASQETAIEAVETRQGERKRNSVEDSARDHLRGFCRTIPSFLMAYGDSETRLENFDRIIPDAVFKEVTSITLDQFRALRDGYDYVDENGETQHFPGNLFDPVVFDDSVREFMRLRLNLADYFDEKNEEDIFDYIPPQRTNQIFTPKKVVRQMVDLLEQENPGCFDDPDKTFADLYMKSGLYIAEIVTRLYRSPRMRALFPDRNDRLAHIFAHQVYGLAPTEIIYRIATNFILGFDQDARITKHNFKLCDALPYAKDGTLADRIGEIFGE